MCARRTGEGRACTIPGAGLAAAAVVRSAARPKGSGLASAAARQPPGPPPPAQASSGAPPFGLVAHSLRAREGGYGLPGRAVGLARWSALPCGRASVRAAWPVFSTGEGPPAQPSCSACRFWWTCYRSFVVTWAIHGGWCPFIYGGKFSSLNSELA